MTVHWARYRQETHLYNVICTLKWKGARLTECEETEEEEGTSVATR